MHEGLQSSSLGLAGRPAEAEEIAVARDIALARATGGRLHLCHLSSARAVELVRRAKAEGVRVTAEVTPHHLVFTDADLATYDTAKKMNPPLRSAEDRDALRDGVADGTIDADRHRPRPARRRGEGHGVRPGAAGDDRPGDRARGRADRSWSSRGSSRWRGRSRRCRRRRRASSAPPTTAARSSWAGPPTWSCSTRTRTGSVEPPFVSKARNSAFTGQRLRGRVRFTMLARRAHRRGREAHAMTSGPAGAARPRGRHRLAWHAPSAPRGSRSARPCSTRAWPATRRS